MKLLKVKKQDIGEEGWKAIPEQYRGKRSESSFCVKTFPSGIEVSVYDYKDTGKDAEHPNYVAIYTPTSNKMRYTTIESPDRMQKVVDFFEPIMNDLKKAIPLAKKIEQEIAQYQAKLKS